MNLRLDASFRSLALWVPVTALTSTVLLAAALLRPSDSQRPMVAVIWIPVAVYLALGKTRVRCNELDMALPLPGRELWGRHLAAVSTAAGLVLGICLLLVGLVRTELARFYPDTPLPDFLHVALLTGAGLLLAVVLLDRPAPHLRRIPVDASFVGWAALVLAGVLALLLLLAGLSPAWAALPLLLAIVVGFDSRRRAPDAYAQVGTELAPATAASDTSQTTSGPPQPTWRLLLRIVDHVPKLGRATPWVIYSLIVFMAMVVSDVSSAWQSSPELRYLYLPLLPYMLFALLGPRTSRLHHLDPLPIPRRRILAVLLLPGVLVLGLGYGLGHLVGRVGADRELVKLHVDDDQVWATVPYRYLGVATDGTVPTLTAPWGEAHRAWSTRPWKGSELRVYSPYSVVGETTSEFEAWLVSRAALDVYGVDATPTEILDRYFVMEDGRITAVAEGGLSLAADHPDATVASAGPYFPVIMTVVLVPWLLVTALLFRSFRTAVPEWVRQTIFWTFLAGSLGLMTAQVVLALAGWVKPEYLSSLWEVALRGIADSPGTVAAIWIGGALAVYGSYRLVAVQFDRMVLPTQPSKFTLVEWTCGSE